MMSLPPRRISASIICCLVTLSVSRAFGATRADDSDVERAASRWITPQSEKAADLGLRLLAKRQNDDGSYGSGPARGNVGICGLVGMAFLSAGSTPGRGRYESNVDRCIDHILANAQPSGFINGPDTAMHGRDVQAWLRHPVSGRMLWHDAAVRTTRDNRQGRQADCWHTE